MSTLGTDAPSSGPRADQFRDVARDRRESRELRPGLSWLRRRRRLAILIAVVVVFVVGDVYLSGLPQMRLLRVAVHCASTSSGNVSHQLG